jgi:hypothetical protein
VLEYKINFVLSQFRNSKSPHPETDVLQQFQHYNHAVKVDKIDERDTCSNVLAANQVIVTPVAARLKCIG